MEEKPANPAGGFIVAALFAAGWFYLSGYPEKEMKGLAYICLAFSLLLVVLATLQVFTGFLAVAWETSWAAISGTSEKKSTLLRFYAFRKALAATIAILIAGFGFFVSYWLRSWSLKLLAVVIPLCLSGLVFQAPEILEKLQGASWYIRIFETGGIPNHDFPSRRAHLLKSAPFVSILAEEEGGYLTHKRYLGQSLRESTGTRKHMWLDDCSCEISYGCIGSGKAVSDLMIAGIINRNSCVFISTKPELADYLLGRRSDPTLHGNTPTEIGFHPGVDARGITKVKHYIPGSRSYLVDPAGQSVYKDSGYPFLHEIDPTRPDEAVALIAAIAMALAVENERAPDPFWQKNTRKFIKAGISHVVTTFPKSCWTLPFVADFLLGVDPQTGVATPQTATKHLKKMIANKSFGGVITTGAVQVYQLGEKAFGAVNAGMGDAFEAFLTPMMRKHLSKPPTWSYRDFGGDQSPVTAFIVPPNIDMEARNTFMRCHAAISTTLFSVRPSLPKSPILFFADEFPQYGKGSGIAEKSLVLRSTRTKLLLYGQNVMAMKNAVGEDFESLASSSTERFYGVNDPETAERLIKFLGQRIAEDGQLYPLASTADILRELDVSSNLQYVKPYSGGQVLRLERRGFKSIHVPDTGLSFRGLPLEGHYDETLSKIK